MDFNRKTCLLLSTVVLMYLIVFNQPKEVNAYFKEKNSIDYATPTNATPANIDSLITQGTPSNSQPSFIYQMPDFVPSWYSQSDLSDYTYWSYIDRYGNYQFRTYGAIDEETLNDWVECNENGEVIKNFVRVDIEKEDLELAPYRYIDTNVSLQAWDLLKEYNQNILAISEFEKIHNLGRNYDGSSYHVWNVKEESKENESVDSYWLYGYQINGCKSAMWYKSNSLGQVIEATPLNINSRLLLEHSVSSFQSNILDNKITATFTGVGTQKDNGYVGLLLLFNNASYSYENDLLVSDRYYDISGFGANNYVDYLLLKPDNSIGEVSQWENPNVSLWRGIDLYNNTMNSAAAENISMTSYYSGNSWYASIELLNPSTYITGIVPYYYYHADNWPKGSYEKAISDIFAIDGSGAHLHTGKTTKVNPTCTNPGTITGTCIMCNEDIDEIIEALGHAEGVPVQINGYFETYCTRCNIQMSKTPITYTIEYHSNGAEGIMLSNQYTFNDSGYLQAIGFTKPGFIFDGWAINPDGLPMYSNYQLVSNLSSINDEIINLYAKWKKTPSRGGSNNSSTTINGNQLIIDDELEVTETIAEQHSVIEEFVNDPMISESEKPIVNNIHKKRSNKKNNSYIINRLKEVISSNLESSSIVESVNDQEEIAVLSKDLVETKVEEPFVDAINKEIKEEINLFEAVRQWFREHIEARVGILLIILFFLCLLFILAKKRKNNRENTNEKRGKSSGDI